MKRNVPFSKEVFYGGYLEVPGPMDSKCWVWRWATNNGSPIYCHAGEKLNVRKLALRNFSKITISPGQVVSSQCQNRLCVNPAHLYVTTKGELLTSSGEGKYELSQLFED